MKAAMTYAAPGRIAHTYDVFSTDPGQNGITVLLGKTQWGAQCIMVDTVLTNSIRTDGNTIISMEAATVPVPGTDTVIPVPIRAIGLHDHDYAREEGPREDGLWRDYATFLGYDADAEVLKWKQSRGINA